MKKPEGLERISVFQDELSLGPYPSLGFVHFAEGDLGNGDFFGLYWPLGREAKEPIVCDMLHDSWALAPSFSCLPKFIEWLEANDWQRGELEIDDACFGPKRFLDAKDMIGRNEVDSAIVALERACSEVPEVSEYWFALAGQLRRAGRTDEGLEAALAAFNSNWAFGLPSEGVLRMLRSPAAVERFPDDPVVQRSKRLTLDFGGHKENADYALLKECVEIYLARDQPVRGLATLQNYAYAMRMTETTAFQERQGFDLAAWQSDFSAKCLAYLGDSRRFSG